MSDSVPIEIMKLGLNYHDYYKGISGNVNRVLAMPDKWEKILNEANAKLPKWAIKVGLGLTMSMSYDREFFRNAKLNYSKGVPVDGCFTVAVADYLLRNQDRLSRNRFN